MLRMLRPRLSSIFVRCVRFTSCRAELAGLHQVLFDHGMTEGICNHLSYMTRENDKEVMLLTPYGRLWNEVTASSLAAITESEAETLNTEGIEVSALTIHWSIHKTRPDARAVLHTHAPYATAMGNLEDPRLQMCHQNCLRFFADISYDKEYGGASNDMDEGGRIANSFHPHTSVLIMQNHGVTVVGPTLALAFDRLYYFERACKTFMLALASGRPVTDMTSTWSEEQILEYRDYIREFEKESAPQHFAAELRNLRRKKSDFES